MGKHISLIILSGKKALFFRNLDAASSVQPHCTRRISLIFRLVQFLPADGPVFAVVVIYPGIVFQSSRLWQGLIPLLLGWCFFGSYK
jgi:hypothetical protein